MTKKLLGTAKDKKTVSGAVKIYSYASDKAVSAGRATRAQIGAIRAEPARLTRALPPSPKAPASGNARASAARVAKKTAWRKDATSGVKSFYDAGVRL